MSTHVDVTFEPSGVVVRVPRGSTVLEAARAGHVLIPAACGGRGRCGSCAVRVLHGTVGDVTAAELTALKRAPHDVRLACQTRVLGPVVVRPLLVTLDHLEAELSAAASAASLVAAVDLGTTSVVARAATATGGRELGSASVSNAQQSWGADVLSRIVAATGGEAGVLTDASRASVASALRAALPAGSSLNRIVVSGNSTMAGLFAGADVSALGAHPFTSPNYAVFGDGVMLGREYAGIELILLPPIASFVGGDTLAGLVDTGMLWSDEPQMLVDLGTNAEIALVADGGLWVASAAAGPAFEAVGIEHGMPAREGAVLGVARGDEGDGLSLSVMGDGPPLGIAGSGLVSVAALLVRTGHLGADGRMSPDGPLSNRFEAGASGVLRFVLAEEPEPLAVTQLDIRALQLAKAAVRVGVGQVLCAAGVTARDLSAVHVAGAFGEGLLEEDLIDLGVLPSSVGGRIFTVGNASLEGALEVALEPDILPQVTRRAQAATHVELAADAAFNAMLLEAVALAPFDA